VKTGVKAGGRVREESRSTSRPSRRWDDAAREVLIVKTGVKAGEVVCADGV
jgi:hypothetical protein